MSKIQANFETSSRGEVLAICDIVTKYLIAKLQDPETTLPIVIQLYGSKDGGKSIFWDRIRENLLEKGGIFINNLSNSSEADERHHETWHGDARLGQNIKKLRMFFANVHSLMGKRSELQQSNPLIQKITRGSIEYMLTLGDIILLSNNKLGTSGKYPISMSIYVDNIGHPYEQNNQRKNILVHFKDYKNAPQFSKETPALVWVSQQPT